ncbi:hypothetical protein ACFL3U_03415 [Pseudomonadota bacterium]
MEGLDYWRLCDELTVIQAALLIAGEDPSTSQHYVEGWEPEKRPVGYEPAKAAVSNALKRKVIEGSHACLLEFDINGHCQGSIDGSIDISASLVDVYSLRTWLSNRGLKTGFFFPSGSEKPDYLDQNHPRYAPKLAAAVNAWMAVGGTSIEGTSAKKVIEKWIREHAAEFGLTDTDGNPVNQAVEDCSKVANWNLGGGAPKTPG